MSDVHIGAAAGSDLEDIVGVLVDAFTDDPVQRWLFAPADDPDTARRILFSRVVPGHLALGLSDVASVAGRVVGTALWSPPGEHALRGPEVTSLMVALRPHLGDEVVPRLNELARSNEFRPAGAHLYLGTLGVAGAHQGRGVGAALLAGPLAECDRRGVLAHLESSNPRNLSLYERHGFRVTGEYRCGSDDGPTMTIMTRRPV